MKNCKNKSTLLYNLLLFLNNKFWKLLCNIFVEITMLQKVPKGWKTMLKNIALKLPKTYNFVGYPIPTYSYRLELFSSLSLLIIRSVIKIKTYEQLFFETVQYKNQIPPTYNISV